MADITVVATPEAETVSEVVAETSEAVAAEETAQVETTAEAAVAVAAIEAERDVEIAGINAEARAAEAEAYASNVGDAEWRQSIEARLNSQEETNREILSTLQALREQSPPNPPPEAESPAAMPESREAPEPKARPKQVHHRLI